MTDEKQEKRREKRGGVLRAAAALEYCTSDTVPTFYRRASKLTLKKTHDLHLWLKAASYQKKRKKEKKNRLFEMFSLLL